MLYEVITPGYPGVVNPGTVWALLRGEVFQCPVDARTDLAHNLAVGFASDFYFLPTMLPMIAAANLWLFFYTPDIGLLDQILGAFGVSYNFV